MLKLKYPHVKKSILLIMHVKVLSCSHICTKYEPAQIDKFNILGISSWFRTSFVVIGICYIQTPKAITS